MQFFCLFVVVIIVVVFLYLPIVISMPRLAQRSRGETLESMGIPPSTLKSPLLSSSRNKYTSVSIAADTTRLSSSGGSERFRNSKSEDREGINSRCLPNHLRVINVYEGQNIKVPSLGFLNHQLPLLHTFYQHEWQPDIENAAIGARGQDPSNEQTQYRQNIARTKKHRIKTSKRFCPRTAFCRTGTTLSAETWLHLVPHVVWGSAMTLPTATRLSHPFIAPLHSKLITVTSKMMSQYFMRTFPLMKDSKGSTPCTPPTPYVLLVHYSTSPVFVNHCKVPQGRSCLIEQGDVISFLESAFDLYSGILTPCPKENIVEPLPMNNTISRRDGHQDETTRRSRAQGVSEFGDQEGVNVDEEGECGRSTSYLVPPSPFCGCEEVHTKLDSSCVPVTSSDDENENEMDVVRGLCVETMRGLFCKSVVKNLFKSIKNIVLDGDEWWALDEEDFFTELWQWKKCLEDVSQHSCPWGHLFNVGPSLQWKIPRISKRVIRCIYRHARWKMGERWTAVGDVVMNTELGEEEEEEEEEKEYDTLVFPSPIVENWRVTQVPTSELSSALNEKTHNPQEVGQVNGGQVYLKQIGNSTSNRLNLSIMRTEPKNSNEPLLSCIELVPAMLPVYLFSHEDSLDTMDYTQMTYERRPWLLESMATDEVYYYEDEDADGQLQGSQRKSDRRKKEHGIDRESQSSKTELAIENCWIDYSYDRILRRKKRRRL